MELQSTDTTAQLDAALATLLERLGPAQRSHLARRIGTDLRKAQAERIKSQQDPDGTSYAPRRTLRDKQGRLRGRMFERIATAKHLKLQTGPDESALTFTGRTARIANVHQYGLEDTVNRHGLRIRYPIRQLLGFTAADRQQIASTVLEHLAL